MDSFVYLSKELNIDQKQLELIARKAPFLYRHRQKPKRNGGIRDISIPQENLKDVQEKILHRFLYSKIKVLSCAHGGVPGKSIKTNASHHINKRVVANIDIKNFFPSIHTSKIKKALHSLGFEEALINLLSRLLTHDHQLPQGAPTSPFVSNLVMIECDRAIMNLCKKYHLTYTRYFDDMTISGKNADKFVSKVIKIINQFGFKENKKKLERGIQYRGQNQIVTGLIVNKKLQIPPDTQSKIIISIEKLASGTFSGKNFIKETDTLWGMIAFLSDIEPKKGNVLRQRLTLVLKSENLI